MANFLKILGSLAASGVILQVATQIADVVAANNPSLHSMIITVVGALVGLANLFVNKPRSADAATRATDGSVTVRKDF